MSNHPKFPVKLNDGRRLEVTVNELCYLIEQKAVEIVPNGGFPAVFTALGMMYKAQARGVVDRDTKQFRGTPAAPQDHEWYERQDEDIRVAYRKGRVDAFNGNVHDLSQLEEDDDEDAAYIRGVKSVPEHRRGELAPRPVADRPQA